MPMCMCMRLRMCMCLPFSHSRPRGRQGTFRLRGNKFLTVTTCLCSLIRCAPACMCVQVWFFMNSCSRTYDSVSFAKSSTWTTRHIQGSEEINVWLSGTDQPWKDRVCLFVSYLPGHFTWSCSRLNDGDHVQFSMDVLTDLHILLGHAVAWVTVSIYRRRCNP